MHIGFFFNNKNSEITDLRYPEEGNPGVGGTWYCFLILMRYLALQKKEWKFTVYTRCHADFPDGICAEIF